MRTSLSHGLLLLALAITVAGIAAQAQAQQYPTKPITLVIPLPPGTNTIIAIPLVLVSAQMAAGRTSPWFPARVNRRGVTKAELQTLIAKMGWFEERVERIFRPRLGELTGPAATRVIGLVCVVLSVIAGLPILMIHNAPAVAIVLFGLGLIYRDGVLVIVAAVAAVLSILFDAALVIWGVAAIKYAAAWLHG